MELPKCRTCGERHRLGGCPSSVQTKMWDRDRGTVHLPPHPKEKVSFNESRDGVDRHAGKERAPTRTSVELPPPISRSAKGSPVSSPARASKPAKKAKPKKKGKTDGDSKGRNKRRDGKAGGDKPVGQRNKRADSQHRGSDSKHSTRRTADVGSGTDRLPVAGDGVQNRRGEQGKTDTASAGAIKVGPPRKGEEHKTLTATKPWEKLGMSRAKWYRIGKSAPEEKR